MKFSELLEHAGTVLDDRTDIIEGASDELWPDELLARYFVEAEAKFARESWCIADTTTREVCTIHLQSGEALYKTHPSILRVSAARFSDTDTPLTRARWRGALPRAADTGRATHYEISPSVRAIVLSNPPDTTTALLDLQLEVFRLPLLQLSLDRTDQESEIPEQYHIELCDWVYYRALTQPTADKEQRIAAREYRDVFLSSMRLARRDRIRDETSAGEWGFTYAQAE